MNDPVLGALLDSETLVLAVGLKPHWGLAMDGLAAGTGSDHDRVHRCVGDQRRRPGPTGWRRWAGG